MKTKELTELEICKLKLEEANQYIASLKEEIRSFTNRNRTRPYLINGWSVQFYGGYFRLFKRVNGRMHGIYLGKVCDEDLARRKIRIKMLQLSKADKNKHQKKERKHGGKNQRKG